MYSLVAPLEGLELTVVVEECECVRSGDSQGRLGAVVLRWELWFSEELRRLQVVLR